MANMSGKYSEQVGNALRDAHQPTDGNHYDNSPFSCLGGGNGDIKFYSFCGGGCGDGGKNKNDYCI